MKKIIIILLSLLMLVSLSACHGTVKEKVAYEVPSEFDESKNYEITFWAKNDTNSNQVRVYQQTIASFEEIYPNITVNLKLYTDYRRIYDDVITNISTNTTPNVCISYPDHMATYITGNDTLIDLETFINDEEFGLGGNKLKYDGPSKDEVITKYLDECKIDGVQYGLPYMRSSEAVYINKDYVEKLGYEVPEILTWDWIFEVSNKATKKNSDGTYWVNNQNVMIPFIYKSTDNMMIQMLYQLGAPYTNENCEILLFNDYAKSIMYDIAENTESGAFSTFKNVSYPANFLNAGQCIFAVDSTAGSTWMGSDAPLIDIAEENIVEFETVIRPVPQYDENNPLMISQGPSICVFNKEDSGEVLASWLFAQFLLTNETQIAYSKTEGYVPVTTKAQESDEFKEYLNSAGKDNNEFYDIKIKAQQMLLENIDNTFTTPAFNGSASIREAAGQLIESAVKRIVMKRPFNDEFIEDVFNNCVSLYHLDQISMTNSGSIDDLGPLPNEAKLLIGGIGLVWVGIAVYFVSSRKNKK